jgi:stage II sporulation protein D
MSLPQGSLKIGLESLGGSLELPVKLPLGGRAWDGITGQKLARLPANKPLRAVADYASGTVRLRGAGVSVSRPVLVLSGGLAQLGGRRYPGKIRIRLQGSGLQFINELSIEQYLEGVLPGEIPRSFGMEAQKALAVAARTYALVQRGKHGDYDLCDGTDCQMYLGYRRSSPRALAAVRATRHLCLWYGDSLVYTFYEADCGGKSTRIEDVPIRDKPSQPLPYLTIVKDGPEHGPDYCAESEYHHWTKRLARQDLEAKLNSSEETYVGRLLELKVTERDGSGRIASITLRGEVPPPLPPPVPADPSNPDGAGSASASGTAPEGAASPVPAPPPVSVPPPGPPGTPVRKTLTGWRFRRAVGARTMKSTLVKVDESQPDLFRFIGSGNGHGLGLCQIGANGMAKRGFTFRQILAHYYPGTRLAPLPKS